MAIAFDASVSGPSGGAGPHTFSLTTTGANIVVIVGCLADGTITSVTYNGSALTAINSRAAGNGYTMYTFALALGAGLGAKNVVVTKNTATDMYPIAASYTGCSQTGIPDASFTMLDTTHANFAITWNTVADNAWQYAFLYNISGSGGQNAGANTLDRQNNTFAGVQLFDSNGPRTPAGSNSLNVTVVFTENTACAAFSLAPPAAAGKFFRQPLLNGLGAGGPFFNNPLG